MHTDQLKNEVIIMLNNYTEEKAIVNLQPLADLFRMTECNNGRSLAKEVRRIKDNMLSGFDPKGEIDFSTMKNDYVMLETIAFIVEQFTLKNIDPDHPD